jgi:hypothetical protein
MDGHCISGASRTGAATLADAGRLGGGFVDLVRELCASADADAVSPSRMMIEARRTRVRGTQQAYRLAGPAAARAIVVTRR